MEYFIIIVANIISQIIIFATLSKTENLKANQIKMQLFECQSALTYQQTISLINKVEKRLNKS